LFYTPETYGGHPRRYHLLPFRFLHLDGGELLVNEAGEYFMAAAGTAEILVRHKLETNNGLYTTLKAKHFVWDGDTDPLLDVLATKYRTKKSFLDNGPTLHIMVLTQRCDNACRYCQITSQNRDQRGYDMSRETARRSLELVMRSPGKQLTIEFQGGEPLLNLDVLEYTIDAAHELATKNGKHVALVLATNLAHASDDVLTFLRDRAVKISTSLDGPEYLHNANRPRHRENSYQVTVDRIKRAREFVGFENVSALMTTTKASLQYPREIVDEYVAQGFQAIFLRSLSPYGFAANNSELSYTVDEFLRFYVAALEYIIELNRHGNRMSEVFATIVLTKILTPYPTGYVDLQSPCGAGNTVLVYNHNGDVYPSDEARMLSAMGNETFRLGNVHDDYFNIARSPAYEYLMSAACNETLPGCAECAFQAYCGSDPVRCHASQGDSYGNRPTSEFCAKHKRILTHLFRLLRSADPELLRMFFGWIRPSVDGAQKCD
jgi:His-Xaa-Ser system radical SAM maturase HxsB